MKAVRPTSTTLAAWAQHFVPKQDFFFLNKRDLPPFIPYIKDVLIIPRQEFHNHPASADVQLASCFAFWQISKQADNVILANPSWLENMPFQQRKQLLSLQHAYSRGLVLSLSYFREACIDEEFIVSDSVVIQAAMWERQTLDQKQAILFQYAQEWDNWICDTIPKKLPDHLLGVVNTFPEKSGANCLAAVLFAISAIEWILSEWVHPGTFFTYLKTAAYVAIEDTPQQDDVTIWTNANEDIPHAAYCVTAQLFFNKNGQTPFNP
ncbi:hypothetical protein [Shouchella patagoniensis]|uniref:hypothetical protein n=1 Tax=Shouchella patagoniensis TaxID=228576 RepID=UPI000995A6A6|nr:hypothetical protein [Shouchella patagoniensis]